MAIETPLPEPHAKQNPTAPSLIAIIAWMVPGLGHLVERRWGRAAGLFLATGGLALLGYTLRGEVFSPRSHDAFGVLGFIADLGSGIFYLLGRFIESGGADLSRASGDYGTRLIAASGIVNLLGVLDAYSIARGWRT